MQWFRLHNKLLNDPTVQGLPAGQFKVYINLLCYASSIDKSGHVGTLQDVSFALRETIEHVSSCFIAFHEVGLIVTSVTDSETFHIPQWQKKQYESDSSTDRVRKHRESKKRSKTVTVTAPEQIQIQIQNRTEQSKTDAFESLWKDFKIEYGSKGSKSKAKTQFLKIPVKNHLLLTESLKKQITAKKSERAAGQFSPNFPHVDRWLRDGRFEDEIIITQQTQELII